jgi:hypothetical protein
MTSIGVASPPRPATSSPLPAALARLEIGHYLRHPLFLLGLALNVLICLKRPDPQSSVMLNSIVPAAGFGVLGIFVMASLTRDSEMLRATAGVVPVPERRRSLALMAACLVPFTAGLAWWAWELVAYHHHPPTANGFPFGPVDHLWVAAVLFGEGPLACLGGPLLGILVGRWLGGRAAPALTAVGVIVASILMQGLFEPLRRIRVVMPWTYFGGPAGIHGDANRTLIYSGSPLWWCGYVACLCALGAVGILLHDREAPRRPLSTTAGGIGAVALVMVLLAMWTGIDHTLVNPLRSSSP